MDNILALSKKFDENHVAAALFSKLVSPENRTLNTLLEKLTYKEVFDLLISIAKKEVGENDLFSDVDFQELNRVDQNSSKNTSKSFLFVKNLADKFFSEFSRLDSSGFLEQLDSVEDSNLVIQSDKNWPISIDCLGYRKPYCLYTRTQNQEAFKNLKSIATYNSVAIVGSRLTTNYGKKIAYNFAEEISKRGYCVVSGGAIGIDSAAHRGALSENNFCFFAGGVDNYYPAANISLFNQMFDSGAVFLSEMPFGATPRRHRFLKRNRLMAGFCNTVVVVEAAWRSGAISTANEACKLNKRVLAVPGSILEPYSSGCHRLIKENRAQLVSNVQDVIDVIRIEDNNDVARDTEGYAVDKFEITSDENHAFVYDSLKKNVFVGSDEILREVNSRADIPINKLFAILGRLENEGVIVSKENGWKRK